MVELLQKISGTWRSLEAARNHGAVRSCIPTKRKRAQDVFDGMWLLFEENTPAPGSRPSDLIALQLDRRSSPHAAET